jgi:NAD(P)-dependent dehydrogenase (short-subunit alcohol dehydrogenase family)
VGNLPQEIGNCQRTCHEVGKTMRQACFVTGGRQGASAYAASNGGVDVVTVGFAKEMAAGAVRVNAVSPGVTDADMIEPIRHGARRAAIAASIPIERYADAAEVAQAIVWLLSENAYYVTGAQLNVAGGGFHVGAPGR